MHRDVAGAIEAMGLILEPTYGPIPPHKVVRRNPRWHKEEFTWQPIRAHRASLYSDNTSRLVYDPKIIEDYIAKDADYPVKENTAYVCYALLHDVFHMYQAQRGVVRQSHQNHWIEGCADAAAIAFILGNSRASRQISEIATRYLRAPVSMEDIEDIAIRQLARKLVALTQRKLIASANVEWLYLPFSLSQHNQARTDDVATRWFTEKIWASQSTLKYTLGAYRLWRIAAIEGVAMSHLLMTPISDRRLRNKARSLGEKRPGA